MVLLSEAVFKRISPQQMHELCVIFNVGEHRLSDLLLPSTTIYQVDEVIDAYSCLPLKNVMLSRFRRPCVPIFAQPYWK